jgi:hypothetical protein
MDGWSVAWILWALVWWLVRGAGLWHHLARLALAAGLAWLVPHLLGSTS